MHGSRSWCWRIVVAALPLLGMGMLGGGSPSVPERNFRGAFVDRDGTRVEAAWITAAGEVALAGELGRGTLRVPFDDIRSIEFAVGGSEPLTARVRLRRGETVDLKVRASLAFRGRTPLGIYEVRARDLKSVELESE
jgi:hypothetical protein